MGVFGSVVCTAMAPGDLARAVVQEAQWLLCEFYTERGDGKSSASPLKSHTHHRNLSYLAYDGTMSEEYVDQVAYLLDYRAHASRFAHQLDDAMGHYTLASSSEEDRLTVHNALSAMIGSAWRRYDEWDLIDREELIVGGTYDGTPLWKRNLEDYIQIDEALCGQCDASTFARRFLFHADLPAFRRLWRQGIPWTGDMP